MRLLYVVLGIQLALGVTFAALAATGNIPFTSDEPEEHAVRADRFDSRAAYDLMREQVDMGPRPTGSRANRRLADRLRRLLPQGRFASAPDGVRNVIGGVVGKDPNRQVVVGAHFDTKDQPGFVGANDGASGTAVAVELARTLKTRQVRPTVVFILFDGEESPRGTPDSQFEQKGLRGSKSIAPGFKDAEAMILLDFVGDRELSTPREANSDGALWAKLRAAARRTGNGAAFPAGTAGGISDDHLPFIKEGVPSIDLIDFDFPCWHERCDDMSAVSEHSLDVSGETVLQLLRQL